MMVDNENRIVMNHLNDSYQHRIPWSWWQHASVLQRRPGLILASQESQKWKATKRQLNTHHITAGTHESTVACRCYSRRWQERVSKRWLQWVFTVRLSLNPQNWAWRFCLILHLVYVTLRKWWGERKGLQLMGSCCSLSVNKNWVQ